MSKGTELTKTADVEVINADVAQVIDAAKLYAEGFRTSLNHAKGYGLLFGTALNQLKEITPHGQFTALAERTFPDHKLRWLQNLMNYAEARKLKNAVTAFLPDGQLLLDLPDRERDKLFAEVEEITRGKSIEEIALEVVKKKHKDKPKTEPEPGEEAKRKAESACKAVAELRQKFAILTKSKMLALVPDDLLEDLEEDRITFGRHIAEITKHRKKQKS